MAKSLTREQLAALEAVHGPGRVVTLFVGDSDFAFLAHGQDKVKAMLQREADGATDMLEFAMRQALLCPAAPLAGRGPAEDMKLDPIARGAMEAERSALEAALNRAPVTGDTLGQMLAADSGYGVTFDTSKDGATYCFIATLGDGMGGTLDIPPVVITAKRPERPQYAVWREKNEDRWEAAMYLFDVCCTSGNADEVKRRWPFAAFALGNRMFPGLGIEEALVGRKKFPTAASDSTTP